MTELTFRDITEPSPYSHAYANASLGTAFAEKATDETSTTIKKIYAELDIPLI
jgi:hypothetical protein